MVEEPRWKVRYYRNGVTVPIEVSAPDEETAIMRAGMKRTQDHTKWFAVGFSCFRYGQKWERLDVTCLDVIN